MTILHAIYLGFGCFVAGVVLTIIYKNKVFAKINAERVALANRIRPKE